MIDPRNVPNLILVKNRWELDILKPSAPAWNYGKFRGQLGFVYIVSRGSACKIGMTANFEKRFRALCAGSPEPSTKVAARHVPKAGMAMAEAWLHKKFAAQRLNGEWFDISPETALASMTDALRVARAYDRYCNEYDLAEREYARRPEVRARRLTAYLDFLDQHPDIKKREEYKTEKLRHSVKDAGRLAVRHCTVLRHDKPALERKPHDDDNDRPGDKPEHL